MKILGLILIFLSVNVNAAMECQKTLPIDEKALAQITESIDKIITLVDYSEISVEAKRDHFNILQNNIDIDNLLIELNHISTFCNAINENTSIIESKKFELLNVFITAIKEANLQFSKVSLNSEDDPSIAIKSQWYNAGRQYKLFDGNIILNIKKIYEANRKHIANIELKVPHRSLYKAERFGFGNSYNKLSFNYRKRNFKLEFIDIDIDEQRINIMVREIF